MFHTIVAGLKSARAPTEIRQEFLKRGESVDVTNFRNDGGQSRDTAKWKTLRLTRQAVEESSDLLVEVKNGRL